jgi:hypothetical protein
VGSNPTLSAIPTPPEGPLRGRRVLAGFENEIERRLDRSAELREARLQKDAT